MIGYMSEDNIEELVLISREELEFLQNYIKTHSGANTQNGSSVHADEPSESSEAFKKEEEGGQERQSSQ